MANYIESLIKSWADDEMLGVNLKVVHLEERLFKTYEPNKFVAGEFWTRCEEWLRCGSSDAERKTMFKLLTQLIYMGPSEIEELFRTAYEGPVAHWLINKDNIDVCAPGAQELLHLSLNQTWFCPVTDSFRINSFYHINNLPPRANLRPDWCSLFEFADRPAVGRYIARNRIRRLVLLEDFVGGGSQSIAAVRLAATEFAGLDVLFVPMIICPAGARRARELEIEVNNVRPGGLTFSPVLELPTSAFFTETLSSLSAENTLALRELIDATYPKVSGGVPKGQKPYDQYGFPPDEPTGGLVVMYTNTPDNTLPIIHWRPENHAWKPVFPRHSRV